MKRKVFIRNATAAAVFPFFLDLMSACNKATTRHNRVFVIVQLEGGNDGLNTLIPLDNYKKIAEARSNLFIPENKILDLKGVSDAGLHPSLEGIRDLYNNGLASFVQGVGYEHPQLSHFRSTDIWLTGSQAYEVLYTGWMARYLETRYKNYPKGFPNAQHPDPPAIKIGDTGTYLFQGEAMDMSIVIDPSTDFAAAEVDAASGEAEGYAAQEIKTIREMLLQSERYSKTLQRALAVSFSHSKQYPKTGENPLADQLKVVAKLIKAGLQTSVYMVDLKGFDTHNAQVDPKDTTKGVHADLLAKLSQAITCFWEDINSIGRENDVAGMTFSEFGRRIMSNASYGTDHGSSQPILFFGADIRPCIIGSNPVIPENVTVTDNLNLQYDYRAVYASVLKDWFGADKNTIKHIVPGNFPELKIIKT